MYSPSDLIAKNPADSSIIWEGKMATELEIDDAFNNAKRAFSTWATLDLNTRINYILKFKEELTKNSELCALEISKAVGKPRWEANLEIKSILNKIDISIDAIKTRQHIKIIPHEKMQGQICYKPLGVIAVISPFNFPGHLSHGHIIPALLAGNTVLFKPSSFTPNVAECLVKCWHNSGLPSGVLNLLQGDRKIAEAILKNSIQGVFFTGSYEAGTEINKMLANRPHILLALEMGGNNPLIIDEVSNINAALYNTIISTLITAGQRCTCARRVFIPDSAFGDLFLSQLIKIVKNIKIGSYTENPEPFIGPVISALHAKNHLKAQEKLIKSGAKALMPMQNIKENTGFLSPGILDSTNIKFDEEIFAPLINIKFYKHFDDAIIKANETKYGLIAGLISDSKKYFNLFYSKIYSGVIHWNLPTTGASSKLPFGGIGRSGNHRPSAYFATDYCAYPVASLIEEELDLPKNKFPGIPELL